MFTSFAKDSILEVFFLIFKVEWIIFYPLFENGVWK